MAFVEEGALAVSLADLKGYLRIELAAEDALLTRLIRVATDLCERFVGQGLMQRDAEEVMPVTGAWQRLSARPVVAIESAMGVPAEGAEFALPVESYAVDIDRNGDGWVKVVTPGAAGRVRVRYRAGLAADADAVPQGVRQGIVRMAAEMHVQRDGDAVVPPAAVVALWRPWRRMRLS